MLNNFLTFGHPLEHDQKQNTAYQGHAEIQVSNHNGVFGKFGVDYKYFWYDGGDVIKLCGVSCDDEHMRFF